VGPTHPVRRGLHRAPGDPRRRLRRGDPRLRCQSGHRRTRAGHDQVGARRECDRLLVRAPDPSGGAVRGTIPGALSPVPIAGLLPGIYQDDLFTQQFTGGLDDVLAPVFTTLDCLDTYVDPWLAPEDFLEWLA